MPLSVMLVASIAVTVPITSCFWAVDVAVADVVGVTAAGAEAIAIALNALNANALRTKTDITDIRNVFFIATSK